MRRAQLSRHFGVKSHLPTRSPRRPADDWRCEAVMQDTSGVAGGWQG